MSATIRVSALVLSLVLLLPRHFFQPLQSGLDGSWVIALHLAFERGLVFGRELFFTFGPLGVLATRIPVGEGIRALLIAYDIFFYLNLVNILWFALSTARPAFRAAAVITVTLIHSQALYFLDPTVMLLLFSFFWLSRAQETDTERHYVFALANALLSFFMKGNFGALSLIFVVGWNILAFAGRRRIRDIARVLYSVAALFAGARVFGAELPGYLLGNWHFAAAYADAMGVEVKKFRPVVQMSALAGIGIGSAFLYWAVRERKELKSVFRAVWLGAVTFLLWKQAVVRADAHVWIFLESAPLVLSAAMLFIPPRVRTAIGGAALVSLAGLIALTAERYSGNIFHAKLEDARRTAAQLRSRPLAIPSGGIPTESVIAPELRDIAGTEPVDFVPWEISSAWYYGMNYRPRGVIQSYAAYDSWLDGQGAAGLARDSAPRYIFYRPACIDGRYCLFDEPLTKLAILERYLVRASAGPDILLERMDGASKFEKKRIRLAKAKLGERIELPKDEGLLLFRVTLDYSARGRLRRAVFRPSELKVILERRDGSTRKFRGVLPLLRSGVPAQYWISSPEEARAFFSGQLESLELLRSIELDSAERRDFESEFSYEFVSYRRLVPLELLAAK